MQFWRALVVGQKKRRGRIYTWGIQELALVSSSEFDEVEFISNNADFIASSLGIGNVEFLFCSFRHSIEDAELRVRRFKAACC